MHELLGSGLTAVELGDSVAGSYCGRLLLQLGATVIKVEPVGGSPLRALKPLIGPQHISAPFTALNAGKQVVTASLDTSDGRTFVRGLLEQQGDLVIMSGPESDWADLELSARQIHAISPRAVIGRVTTFGDAGPHARMAGGDLQVQALGGLMHMVGDPDREPLRIGGDQAQYSAGLAMLTGFALGLASRALNGEGRAFTTSALETVGQIEWKSALWYQDTGEVMTRMGMSGDPTILKAQDGYFALFFRPADWPAVVAIMDDARLGSERFSTTENRELNREALLEILNESAAKFTKRDLYHQAQSARLPMGYMATMGDLLGSEQYEARNFFEDVDLGELGTGKLPGAPWRLRGAT